MKGNPFVDLRKQMGSLTMTVGRDFKVNVDFKNKTLVFLGLRVIQFGCFLCGMRFEEE